VTWTDTVAIPLPEPEPEPEPPPSTPVAPLSPGICRWAHCVSADAAQKPSCEQAWPATQSVSAVQASVHSGTSGP